MEKFFRRLRIEKSKTGIIFKDEFSIAYGVFLLQYLPDKIELHCSYFINVSHDFQYHFSVAETSTVSGNNIVLTCAKNNCCKEISLNLPEISKMAKL